jgi:hypothetical protein
MQESMTEKSLRYTHESVCAGEVLQKPPVKRRVQKPPPRESSPPRREASPKPRAVSYITPKRTSYAT